MALAPSGVGTVEAWTVVYSPKPNEPSVGVAIGTMAGGPDAGRRFVARTRPGDTVTMAWLAGPSGQLGAEVLVECDGVPVPAPFPYTGEKVYRVWFSRRAASAL